MCLPLYGRGHKLHVGVNDSVCLGQYWQADLALQALGPSPGDGELNGLGVPPVLRVLVGRGGWQ